MHVTAPAWLTSRGGTLQPGSDRRTWFVTFAGQAQYALVPVPVGGAVGCVIRQTINGRRVDSSVTAASPEAAVQAGLEDLRKTLGW